MKFGFVLVLGAGVAANAATSAELTPIKVTPVGRLEIERYSERTLTAAIQVDREQARLIAFTVKSRPFERVKNGAPMTPGDSFAAHIEIRLQGADGRWLAVPVEVHGLCLEHAPDTPPHVE